MKITFKQPFFLSTKQTIMLEEMILNLETCFKGILEYAQKEGDERSLDEVVDH